MQDQALFTNLIKIRFFCQELCFAWIRARRLTPLTRLPRTTFERADRGRDIPLLAPAMRKRSPHGASDPVVVRRAYIELGPTPRPLSLGAVVRSGPGGRQRKPPA
jgi:hypothetical protein